MVCAIFFLSMLFLSVQEDAARAAMTTKHLLALEEGVTKYTTAPRPDSSASNNANAEVKQRDSEIKALQVNIKNAQQAFEQVCLICKSLLQNIYKLRRIPLS